MAVSAIGTIVLPAGQPNWAVYNQEGISRLPPSNLFLIQQDSPKEEEWGWQQMAKPLLQLSPPPLGEPGSDVMVSGDDITSRCLLLGAVPLAMLPSHTNNIRRCRW